MVKVLRGLLVCLSLFALTTAAASPEPLPRATPEAVGLSSARLRRATDMLRQFIAEGKVAGVVAAVARNGKLVYLESLGHQTLETRTPMAEGSIFRIYSMTKTITAVAAMMLYEEGHFQLSDPVSQYLPEFKELTVLTPDVSTAAANRRPARDVTVQDLFLHTSGLNHRTSEVYRRAQVRSRAMPLPQLISNLARVPLMEDPGTRWRYSESTSVLGRLVEIWSGKPFDVLLSERLFQPLGLVDTGFWVRPVQRERLTTVYRSAPDSGLTPIELESVPFTERPALLEGAVGLVSTVPDYLRFGQMLLNKGQLDNVRILSSRTVEMMTVNRLPDALARMVRPGTGWALGNVTVVLDPRDYAYPVSQGEYGWDGSAGTIFWVDPKENMITILMAQNSPANPDSLRQRFKTLVYQAFVD